MTGNYQVGDWVIVRNPATNVARPGAGQITRIISNGSLGPAYFVRQDGVEAVYTWEFVERVDVANLVYQQQKAKEEAAKVAEAVVEEEDDINHPKHYTSYKGIEVIQLTEQMMFNRGNAVKYIARAGLKSKETEIKDLEKAAWYVNREIARIKEDQK